MEMRGRLGCVAITLAALSGTAACGAQPVVEFIKPVAATSAPDVPLQGAGPAEPSVTKSPAAKTTPSATPTPSKTATGDQTATPSKTAAKPVPEPTVAKTQKWVKIFSGPSPKKITPPKDVTAGTHTVVLNSTLSTQFGAFVADGAGRTLYRFDNDSNKPPKSTCNGSCAKTWPPLLIKSPGKIFPNGINPKILGYVERADGHCQVTINGWPVYYFSGDKKAGDFKGQGLKGVWFAVTPTGGKTRNSLDEPGN